jgi:hypothetical protein
VCGGWPDKMQQAFFWRAACFLRAPPRRPPRLRSLAPRSDKAHVRQTSPRHARDSHERWLAMAGCTSCSGTTARGERGARALKQV